VGFGLRTFTTRFSPIVSEAAIRASGGWHSIFVVWRGRWGRYLAEGLTVRTVELLWFRIHHASATIRANCHVSHVRVSSMGWNKSLSLG
jgi:hypothetical protein